MASDLPIPLPGLFTVKTPLARFTSEWPSTLSIRVHGLSSDVNQAEHYVILARPHLARMALHIIGLVLCAGGTLLSLIWGLLLLGVVKMR